MSKVKILRLAPVMSVEQSDQLQGKMLTRDDCKMLINGDTDVFDSESGKCLAKFRKGIIPAKLLVEAYENLLPAAKATDSRGLAGGEEEGRASQFRQKKDGTISKQSVAKSYVNSGIAGYYDRSTRFPYCRQTAYTQHQLGAFTNALGIVRFVDHCYKRLMPVEYRAQRKIADSTSKDFKINGTSFTTVTVNKNYRTAIHKDSGDFKQGFGNLVALRHGEFDGCYLTLPRWGVGFDLHNSDLLLMDVHQWHGNTPMTPLTPDAVRLSLVMYYRENMVYCGTAKQEVERARNRKVGTKLNDK